MAKLLDLVFETTLTNEDLSYCLLKYVAFKGCETPEEVRERLAEIPSTDEELWIGNICINAIDKMVEDGIPLEEAWRRVHACHLVDPANFIQNAGRLWGYEVIMTFVAACREENRIERKREKKERKRMEEKNEKHKAGGYLQGSYVERCLFCQAICKQQCRPCKERNGAKTYVCSARCQRALLDKCHLND